MVSKLHAHMEPYYITIAGLGVAMNATEGSDPSAVPPVLEKDMNELKALMSQHLPL